MLASDLLIDIPTLIVIIVASAGGALVLLSVIYGCVRKFSRLTWIGWEIFVLFGLTLLISLIPMPENGYWAFGLEFALLTVAVGLVLGADIALRHVCMDRPIPPSRAANAWNHILGGLTGLVTLLMFVLVLGGFVLRAMDSFSAQPILNIGIWTGFYAKYAVDVFTVTVYYLIVRAGYRLGLLNGIFFLLGFALTALSLWLAFKVCLDWDLLVALSQKIGTCFHHQADLNNFLGYIITVFLVFAIFFAASMGIMAVANWGIRIACTTDAVGITNAVISAVLAVAVFMGIYLAFSLGVQYLASGKIGSLVSGIGQTGEFGQAVADGFLKSVTDMIQQFAQRLNDFFASSPVAAVLHNKNFIWLLIG